MREEDLDIVKVILENMPEKNDTQLKIKLYMQIHKTICNEYVYAHFGQRALLLNSVFKELRADLGREILEVLKRKGEV
ncbi:MAG: hypothetical protein IKD77_02705 [Bacilli bacterium]|nr:hypothetical protein [Bacilli bacterium]